MGDVALSLLVVAELLEVEVQETFGVASEVADETLVVVHVVGD